jgi:hypothetical protein
MLAKIMDGLPRRFEVARRAEVVAWKVMGTVSV